MEVTYTPTTEDLECALRFHHWLETEGEVRAMTIVGLRQRIKPHRCELKGRPSFHGIETGDPPQAEYHWWSRWDGDESYTLHVNLHDLIDPGYEAYIEQLTAEAEAAEAERNEQNRIKVERVIQQKEAEDRATYEALHARFGERR